MHRRHLLRAAASALALGAVPARLAWADDAPAVDLDGRAITLGRGDIQAFAAALDGVLVRPDSAQYDLARQVWNGVWDRRPALIARVGSVADVVASVNFARAHRLLTAVRCGGHSMAGKGVCDGGLVIDLGYLNAVSIDVPGRVATVGGGALLGDLDRQSLPFGLGTTAGVVSHTGAGGLILGGGLGRLQRRHGLAIDNVLGVELVTADGRVVRAAADENPDLYWAVRGGGGNFGIVTRFFLRLHAVPPVVGNFLFTYPEAAARDALRRFFDLSNGADRDLFVIASAFVGADGARGVRIVGNWFGAPERLDRVIAPLRKAGQATAERVFPAEYVKVQQAADAGLNAAGNRHYGKGGFVRQVDDALSDAILGSLEPLPGRNFSVALLPMDGAVGEVAPDATPWAHRDARFNLDASSSWPAADAAADARNVAASRDCWRRLEPFTRGFYINGLLDENQDQVTANFGPNYPRLVAAKKRWDPGNLFRLNANVRPDA